MVKGVFSRLIGRSSDTIPYGTQDEEQNVITPVKFAMVLEQSVTATVVPDQPADSLGFVQKLRNSLRRKKKTRDYDKFADRPSPFKTPPAFLSDHQTSTAPAAPNWDSPFGMEVLEESITRKKADQKSFKLDFDCDNQDQHDSLPAAPLLMFGNEENGGPIVPAQKDSKTAADNVAFSSIEAYFKTPDGIRRYHRRSKVFLSNKEDQLI